MFSVSEIMKKCEKGEAPFAFDIGVKPAQLIFSHQRDKRRKPGEKVFVFDVKDAPITVVMETKYIEKHQMLTWKFRFCANGSIKKPISNVRLLDRAFENSQKVRLWNGGFVYNLEDGHNQAMEVFPPREFHMRDHDLEKDGPLDFEDLLGRASVKLLPVWFLYGEDHGVWLAPEWSGSWAMKAEATPQGGHFAFALPVLDFVMHQGEEVQLPPFSMGCYEGSVDDGCVQLRRTIYEEILPTVNDEKPEPPVMCHAIGGSLPQFDWPGLQKEIKVLASLGVEQFVFASCWYRPPEGTKTPFSLEEIQQMFPERKSVAEYQILAFWEQCGNFEPAPERYPEGIMAFVEKLRGQKMIQGLWFDPRVNVMTDCYVSHRDALLEQNDTRPSAKAYQQGLIDMATASGREMMYELLERLVVEFGSDFLWHDLNVHPRPAYWDKFEEPGRRGLRELSHYIHSDEIYDRFMERYPHVWIEWCGGGGSMINLGVLRRCHTLHIADSCGIRDSEVPNADHWRAYRTALNWILPTVYINNHINPPKDNELGMDNLINLLGSTCALHQTVSEWSDSDRAETAKFIGVYKNLRKYLHKDFWSLFPMPEDQTGWDGWQFHDPDTNTGLLVLFKRRNCEEDTVTVQLRWPDDPEQLRYAPVLGNAEAQYGEDGLQIKLTDRAAVIRYDTC